MANLHTPKPCEHVNIETTFMPKNVDQKHLQCVAFAIEEYVSRCHNKTVCFECLARIAIGAHFYYRDYKWEMDNG